MQSMIVDPSRLTRAVQRLRAKNALRQFAGPRGTGLSGAARSDVVASLDAVHQKVRACSNASQLADLVDEYVALTAALLAGSAVVGGLVPGGAILSAAIGGLSQLGGGSTGTGAGSGSGAWG